MGRKALLVPVRGILSGNGIGRCQAHQIRARLFAPEVIMPRAGFFPGEHLGTAPGPLGEGGWPGGWGIAGLPPAGGGERPYTLTLVIRIRADNVPFGEMWLIW